MRKKILFIMLEFPKWQDASHWGYPSNMGMEPGLIANNVDYLIVPATHRYGGRVPFWVDHVRKILGGRKFDQVWIEVVHSNIDDDVLEYLSTIAPVRVGWSFESLELLPVEWTNNPAACKLREEVLSKRLEVITHLLTTDETDAPRLNKLNKFQARPIPPGFSISREFICQNPPPPPVNLGLFYGALYGERKKWLEHPSLAPILRYVPDSPETHTTLPATFDALHESVAPLLQTGAVDSSSLELYLKGLRVVRREAFHLWLEGLRLGAAVVNLPQWGRAYAGRVVEGMAAGRPVIAHEMVDRPLARAAFEDGKEILLYREPHELAEHLNRIIAEPGYGAQIAENARKRLESTHLSENYLGEVITWASK